MLLILPIAEAEVMERDQDIVHSWKGNWANVRDFANFDQLFGT